MMTLNPDNFFSKWFGDSGASEAELSKVESDLGVRFPKDYREFMLLTNGGQGIIGRLRVSIWRLQDLESRNRSQGILAKLPSILGFADDGPGFFGFDTGQKNSIVRIPFGDFHYSMWRRPASSFEEMLVAMKDETIQ